MEVTRFEGADGNKILIGLLTDTIVCARIAPHWTSDLFASTWENLIGNWAIKHYSKYQKPLGMDVVQSFARWAEKTNDKDTHGLVDKFLSQLSARYEQETESPNPEYVLDLASLHFNKILLQKENDEIDALIEAGDIDGAMARRGKAQKIELGASAITNVLEDFDAFEQAFEEKKAPLITFQGHAGIFFGDVLERDGFIGILAPSKRGKTRQLIDFAWRGMLERRKVAFFEVGDMSKSQILRRFAGRAARTPLRPPKGQKWPCTFAWPVGISRDGQLASVETEERMFSGPLNWQMTKEACVKIVKKRTRTKTPLLKLSCHPNGSLSVAGIQNVLVNLEREGWTPDIIVVDYADLLAPLNPRSDVRQQINTTWAGLRALSQTTHSLVITATQASSESFGSDTVQKKHFGEARFKFDHITGMLGISQTPAEKLDNIVRVHWLDVREQENDGATFLHCAGVPAISHPLMVSCL